MSRSTTGKKTVFLHIGLHKTGTTYLQNLFRANRELLRAQAVEFPGGAGQPSQMLAVWDMQGRRPRGAGDARVAGQWNALLRSVDATLLPTILISEERLSVSSGRQARKAIEAFGDHEVHVIVTARDIGRIAVSAWQEAVKNESRYTWREFAAAIEDPESATKNPARSFWIRQDLAKICLTWESVVGADRVHVVTVPPPGSPADLLLERYAAVVGFDPAKLTEAAAWSNETVGTAPTEVLRRMNERIAGRLNQREYDKVVKHTLVPLMVRDTRPDRFGLPSEDMPWATDVARTTIETLKERGYDVAGDLDDLLPVIRDGVRRPDDASSDEVLDSSLDALALLAESYAKAWWARRKPDVGVARPGEGMASKARAVLFSWQRKVGGLADRNPAAHRALRWAMAVRDRPAARARARLGSEQLDSAAAPTGDRD